MIQYNQLLRPLISVIIPSYNHGHYLPTAINSILSQTYKTFEIIIVDDGSTDDTQQIITAFPDIKYFFQKNKGLSAARNRGVKESSGQYLIFLDADDWLFPGALKINFEKICQKPEVAFVAGGYEMIYEPNNTSWIIQENVQEMHYCRLLERNFLGMHASILFQKWIFDIFIYDESLQSCEDYDLYLKIVRRYPILCHPQLISVYRIHAENMSHNNALMLKSALLVLTRQKDLLENKTETLWFEKGMRFWKGYYCERIFEKVVYSFSNNQRVEKTDISVLNDCDPVQYYKLLEHLQGYSHNKIIWRCIVINPYLCKLLIKRRINLALVASRQHLRKLIFFLRFFFNDKMHK